MPSDVPALLVPFSLHSEIEFLLAPVLCLLAFLPDVCTCSRFVRDVPCKSVIYVIKLFVLLIKEEKKEEKEVLESTCGSALSCHGFSKT